jgi:tetratricopeptide (TPR) repeat protein
MERTFCALALGQLQAATACADQLQALFEGHKKIVDEPLKISGYGALATARVHQGKLDLARQAAEQADQLIARSTPSAYQALPGYAGVAEVYLRLWEEELKSQIPNLKSQNPKSQFRAAAGRAVKALHKFAGVFPIGRPRAWLWQGRYEWLSGNHAQARQAWRKCLAAAEKLMMPYAAALAHAELGRYADADDPERGQHLSRARDIFTQLGADGDLERLGEGARP